MGLAGLEAYAFFKRVAKQESTNEAGVYARHTDRAQRTPLGSKTDRGEGSIALAAGGVFDNEFGGVDMVEINRDRA